MEKERYLCDDIDCPDLRYFAYKSRACCQYISSKLAQPYVAPEQRVRLFELIRFVYGRLHHPNHHLKIVFFTTEHEALLGWVCVRANAFIRIYLFLFSYLRDLNYIWFYHR